MTVSSYPSHPAPAFLVAGYGYNYIMCGFGMYAWLDRKKQIIKVIFIMMITNLLVMCLIHLSSIHYYLYVCMNIKSCIPYSYF